MQVLYESYVSLDFILSEHFDIIKNDIDIHVEKLLIEITDCNEVEKINKERNVIIEKIELLKSYNLTEIRFKQGIIEQKWKKLIENRSLSYEFKSNILKEDIVRLDCLIIFNTSNFIGLSLCIFDWYLNEEQIENVRQNYFKYFQSFTKKRLTKACVGKEISLNSNQIKLFHILTTIDQSSDLIKTYQGYSFSSITSLNIQFDSTRGYRIENYAFSEMPNINNLSITCNNQKFFIGENTFRPLSNLNQLSLYNNSLLIFHDSMFNSLIFLKKLNLSANSLVNLNLVGLIKLTLLKEINLSKNNLVKCPKFPNSLEYIDLSQNVNIKLDYFEFFYLKLLKTLDLSRCKLSFLPSKLFDNLNQLENFLLHNNSLAILEEECFWNLAFLKRLELNANMLESLHSNLFLNLKNLEYLDLKQNSLKSFKRDIFCYLTKLRILDLSDNQIEFFPKGLFDNLNYLEELNLSNNQIRILKEENFAHLEKLKRIYFYFNKNLFSIEEFVNCFFKTNPYCKIETEYIF